MFAGILRDLIINLALFTSVIFLIGHSLRETNIYREFPSLTFKGKLIIGVVHGVIGTLILFFGFNIGGETLVDLRHLAIVVSAFFGGLPAAVTTGLIIAVNRIISINGLNLSSVLGAVNAINMAVGTGLISQYVTKHKWKYMNLYCLLSISVIAITLIPEIQALTTVLVLMWGISILSALWVIYLIRYLMSTNRLFQQVQESEEKYRLITENMSDLVSVLDRRGLILYASPSHQTVLNIDVDDYIGSYPHKYIHPDDLQRVRETFRQVMNNKSTLETEYRWKHADGHWIHIDMRGTPIIEENGEVHSIVVASRDITKRKTMEEQLLKTLNELKDLKLALDESSIVSIADSQGKITYANERFCEITGYKKDELIGKSHSITNSGHHPKEFFKHLWETISNGAVWKGEIRNTARNGQSYCFDTTIVPFLNNEGVPYQYVAIRTDITERKKHVHRLRYLSHVDGLTDLANRRYFDEKLEEECQRAYKDATPLSLILFDIDHFKAYNDTYGHQGGDICLQSIAKLMKEVVNHPYDLAARYGGEEFAIILPQTAEEGANIVANKLRQRVEELHIEHKGSSISDVVTISVGVTTSASEPITPEHLIEQADKALYKAKQNGRNQIKTFHTKRITV
ncbi:diguanylate cyclase [Bacillus tianshenii]|nr:diguanylate cyclase [Bacillus tianshenii]